MNYTKSCRTTLTLAAVAAISAAFITTSNVNAGPVPPPLHFSIDVDGVFSDSYQANVAFDLGGGLFAYDIQGVDHASFNFNPTTLTIGKGTPDTLPAGIFTGFAFQNKSSGNLLVTITYLLETDFSKLGSVPFDTNVSIGVNSNTVITTSKNSPFWLVAIDGGTVAQLFVHKTTLAGIDGAASADASADGLADAPAASMSITITFEINPGGQAFFNGNFNMIPAPGALALLAFGGIAAVRRRRRN